MRRILSGLVLLLALGVASCSTAESMFSPTGSLKPQPVDLTLSTQTSAEPSNQFMKWTVSKAEAEVPGVGTVNFLTEPATSCIQVQQTFFLNQPSGATCRFSLSGLALAAGTTGTLTVQLEISDLWVTRGTRPVLTGDVDGDMVPDADDNCPYVANPDQENANAEEEGENPVGDACTNANGAKDSDADGVADIVDNCVYVANEDQAVTAGTEGFVDLTGDACREKIHVTLPGQTLVIRRTDQAFTVGNGGVTYLNFDFRSKDWCPNGVTACSIQPEDVVLNVQ